MKKNIVALLIIILAFVLTAAGGGKTETDGVPKTRALQTVRLVAVEKGSLPRTVTLTGTLAADEEVVASFKVSGRISQIAVNLGSAVTRNQVIARLDPTDFLLHIEQAEAALRQTRARL